MIMNKQFLYTLLLLFPFALFSCTNEVMMEETGMGSIRFSVENEAEEVAIETRALSTKLDVDDFTLRLKRGDETLISSSKYETLKNQTLTYTAGSGYALSVESCTKEDAQLADGNWGQDRVAADTTFTITAGETKDMVVKCKLQNASVGVSISNYIKEKYPDLEVEIYAADATERRFTFNKNTMTSRRAYFNVKGTRALQCTARMGTNDAIKKDITLHPGDYYTISVTLHEEENAPSQVSIAIEVDGTLVDEITWEEKINPYGE